MPRRSAFWVIPAFVAVASCGAGPQATSAPPEQEAPTTAREEANHNGLGPLQIGMSRGTLEAIGMPFETSTTQQEGDEYIRDDVRLSDAVTIRAIIWNNVVAELSTESPAYANPEGAHPGDTLARLRQVYPNGHVSKGSGENGLFFHFLTEQRGQYFSFDTTGLSRECLVSDQGCPNDLESRRSVRLHVR